MRISCRNLDFGGIGILANFPRQTKLFFTTVTSSLGLDCIFYSKDHPYITSAKGLCWWWVRKGPKTCRSSGVFSTGATGATAPVILRKRLIAPVILPGMFPKGRNFEDDLNK